MREDGSWTIEGEPPFVGRRRELTTAESYLDRLRDGRGGCLLVTGAAGAGKTRLAREVAGNARLTGMASAEVACLPLTVPMPLDPILTLVRRLGQDEGPWFHDRASRDLFGTMVSNIADRASAEPLILVVDDLQWADSETIELIVYATDRLAHLPLLWVLTTRDEAGTALSDHIQRLPSGAVTPLKGLTQGEVSELARAILGDAVPGVVDAIHHRTLGNPMLTIELLRSVEGAAAANRTVELAERAIPAGLVNVIGRRRSSLSDGADDVLRWCSVLPEPILIRWIEEVAGQDAREAIPILVDKGFLHASGAAASAFVHGVVKDAVYESMPEPERTDRHSRVADIFADGPSELLAPQLIGAHRLEEAAPVTADLAEEALLRGSPSDANTLYQRARELAERCRLDHQALGATAGLVLSLLRSGEHAEARSTADILLNELRRRNDPAELLEFLSRYAMGLWDDAADLPGALAAVDEAEPLLEGATGSLLAEAALARAHILNRAARTREALPLAERATQAATDAEDEVLEVRCLVHLGLITGQAVGAPEGMEVLERAVTLAHDRRLPAEEAYAYLALSFLSQHCGDEKGHEEYALAGLAVGFLPPPIEAMLRGNAAQGPVSRGELQVAVSGLEQAKEVAHRAGRHVAARLAVTLAHAYIKAGDLAAAHRELDPLSAPAGSWEDQRITYARAFLAEAEGVMEEAHELYRRGCLDTDNPASIWSLAGVLRTSPESDRLEEAASVLEQMNALADRWPVSEWLIPASRGYMRMAQGESARAAALFSEAASSCQDSYTRARLRLDAALCRSDRDAILAAIDSFDEMGAKVAADRARSQARALGMRPGRRRRSQGAMTDRELDVARLVAEGKTNAEIGAELYVSPRTVERHVGNLLRRHGFRSRTELAAAIVAGDLPLS